ncbi:MAG: ATP-binding cassette domain-containing protein [Bacteroidota bacterium]
MQITLSNIGKKYNQDWIFRNINAGFTAGEAYAILGSNGSGKSTLLQIISGRVTQSSGLRAYSIAGVEVSEEDVFRHLTFATPYQELIEEYTVQEMLKLHQKLKPLFSGIGEKEFLDLLAFQRIKDKPIRYFSSGMKQRVKLAFAILSDVPLVLLDEPCSNLDQQGIAWYHALVEKYHENRLFIVCSNHVQEEIAFCTLKLNVNDYK